MLFKYETDRLLIKVCRPEDAKKVLDFYLRDKELFEKYEPDRMPNFYTANYQKKILKWEGNLLLKLESIRFYIFLKENSDIIIGTICIHNITKGIYSTCEVGYKFSSDFQHQGYATEALDLICNIIFKDLKLHRIEARVLPENTQSMKLLARLGFSCEGISRECIYLHGRWEDHYMYSKLNREYTFDIS